MRGAALLLALLLSASSTAWAANYGAASSLPACLPPWSHLGAWPSSPPGAAHLPHPVFPSADTLCTTYVVQSGDSLWSISNKFGVLQDDLVAALESCLSGPPQPPCRSARRSACRATCRPATMSSILASWRPVDDCGGRPATAPFKPVCKPPAPALILTQSGCR